MVPERDKATEGLLSAFKEAMKYGDSAAIILEEGELDGEDDWDVDDSQRFKYWYGVFGR